MKKLQPNPLIMPYSPIFSTLSIKERNKNLYCIKKAKEIHIVFLGTPKESAQVLQELSKSFTAPVEGIKFNIRTVVTSPDSKTGRKQILTPSPVAQVAAKYGIETLKPEKINSEFIMQNLAQLEADLYVLAAFGKILPQKLLDIPRLGTLNLHPSLLPKYRGASPIQSAILNGNKETGISIMLLDEMVDHGPILTQRTLALSGRETFADLAPQLFLLGAKQLVSILPKYVQGEVKAKVQDETQANYCKIIKKENGFFDINNPPSLEILDRMIRAFYPWPNVWTRWHNKIVKFYPDHKVQIEGKNIVSLEDFHRGYPTFPPILLNLP